MKTIDFYTECKQICEKLGYPDPRVVTMSGCYEGRIQHSCQMFDLAKRKHVYSGHHNNPVAALSAFRDNLELHKKEYSQEIESTEL